MASKKKVKHPVKFDTTLEIHSPKSQEDFVCERCLREFQKGERICVLGTYDINQVLTYSKKKKNTFISVGFVSEYFYHIDCWKLWFNEQIKGCVEEMQKKLYELPAVKSALNMIGGIVNK